MSSGKATKRKTGAALGIRTPDLRFTKPGGQAGARGGAGARARTWPKPPGRVRSLEWWNALNAYALGAWDAERGDIQEDDDDPEWQNFPLRLAERAALFADAAEHLAAGGTLPGAR